MTHLERRGWVPDACEDYIQRIAAMAAGASADAVAARIGALIEENHAIHDRDCINLNPATNVMNPRAEAALAAGLGSRPSLGYPGGKYEMGLEADELAGLLQGGKPGRGLAFSREMARANGTELEIETAPGQGLTARILFPAARCLNAV